MKCKLKIMYNSKLTLLHLFWLKITLLICSPRFVAVVIGPAHVRRHRNTTLWLRIACDATVAPRADFFDLTRKRWCDRISVPLQLPMTRAPGKFWRGSSKILWLWFHECGSFMRVIWNTWAHRRSSPSPNADWGSKWLLYNVHRGWDYQRARCNVNQWTDSMRSLPAMRKNVNMVVIALCKRMYLCPFSELVFTK